MNIRNQEQYIDSTPYLAIGGGIPEPGEVYEYRGGHTLVIARKDKMCMVVRLKQKDEFCDVQVRGFWHTNIYQISYMQINRLGDFEFRLTQEEMNSVRKAVIDALGIKLGETNAKSNCNHNQEEQWDELEIVLGRDALIDYCKVNVYTCRLSGDQKRSERYMNKLKELIQREV